MWFVMLRFMLVTDIASSPLFQKCYKVSIFWAFEWIISLLQWRFILQFLCNKFTIKLKNIGLHHWWTLNRRINQRSVLNFNLLMKPQNLSVNHLICVGLVPIISLFFMNIVVTMFFITFLILAMNVWGTQGKHRESYPKIYQLIIKLISVFISITDYFLT